MSIHALIRAGCIELVEVLVAVRHDEDELVQNSYVKCFKDAIRAFELVRFDDVDDLERSLLKLR